MISLILINKIHPISNNTKNKRQLYFLEISLIASKKIMTRANNLNYIHLLGSFSIKEDYYSIESIKNYFCPKKIEDFYVSNSACNQDFKIKGLIKRMKGFF